MAEERHSDSAKMLPASNFSRQSVLPHIGQGPTQVATLY